MAAASGLKPFEVDMMHPKDVWIMIEGHEENIRNNWEMTRAIAFNVAKFGNSDPKKFPKSPQKFWPMSWDTKENPKARIDEILRHHQQNVERRERLKNKK
jgi:hypothetical protein